MTLGDVIDTLRDLAVAPLPAGINRSASVTAIAYDSRRVVSGAVFVARVGPDCDRCPVRTACPAHGAGRGVPEA